jgi:hypothetical protein
MHSASSLRGGLACPLGIAALVLGLSAPVSANPVQRENSKQGDSFWRSRPARSRAIEGYASRASVAPGERIAFFVNTSPRARYRVEIERLGWYGGAGGRRLKCIPACRSDEAGVRQRPAPAPAPGTGYVDAGWSATDSLRIPHTWVSGYYLAELVLTSGRQRGRSSWIPFIVRAPAGSHSGIVVQVPVNTWQAYNPWGGKSLYDFNSTNEIRANHISFDRPLQPHVPELVVFGWEYQLVRFLERTGYDVSYLTDVDTDRDPSALLAHRVVMTAGHDEYWTKRTRDAFDAARDHGVSLAFLGANTGFWQVRYENGSRTMVGYKSADTDPIADPRLKTINFRSLTPPRPECALLGVQGGYSFDPTNPFIHVHPSYSLSPDYSVEPGAVSDPWMARTQFRPGSRLEDLVGYEWDGVYPGCLVPPPKVLFHYEGTCGTAYCPSSAGIPDADAVRYTAPSGARVFSAGSLQFSWGLDDYGHRGHADRRLQRFLRNMLTDMLRAP